MKVKLSIGILAAASLAWSASACAIPVTFGFGGTLTDDPYGVLTDNFSFSGSYTFESTAVDLVPDAQAGVYSSTGSAYGLQSLVAGANYALAGSLSVNVADDFAGPVDQYGVFTSDGLLTLELFFQDFDAAVFGTDLLPLEAPALASFEIAQFRLFGDGVEFLGAINQFACLSGCGSTPTPVSEPGMLWLLLGAMGLLAVARYRRAPEPAAALS